MEIMSHLPSSLRWTTAKLLLNPPPRMLLLLPPPASRRKYQTSTSADFEEQAEAPLTPRGPTRPDGSEDDKTLGSGGRTRTAQRRLAYNRPLLMRGIAGGSRRRNWDVASGREGIGARRELIIIVTGQNRDNGRGSTWRDSPISCVCVCMCLCIKKRETERER